MIKNFIQTFGVRCIILISGLFASICSAHFLGPIGRGEYFFITTLSLLMVQLGNFGMHSSNTYLVAKNEDILGKLATNAIWMSILVGIISALGAWSVLHFQHHSIVGVKFLIILAPSTLFFMLGSNLLIGINKIRAYNLMQIYSNLSVGLALVICGVAGFGVKGFLTATALAWLISAFILVIIIAKYTTLPLGFNFSLFQKGLNFGIKIFLMTTLGALILKGNIVLLKMFTSSTELGYYSIASQINDALIILPTTYSLLLFPNLVKHENNRWMKTRQALFLLCFILGIICILTALSAKFAIPIIFGAKFTPSIPILLAMLPASFFLGTISIISQYLAAQTYLKALIFIWISAFAIMLIAGLVLIPKFSGVGAGLSLSITYSIITIMVLTLAYWVKSKDPMELENLAAGKSNESTQGEAL
jgi:O-antigen/teichoic acid export membrane protein